jgi:tight adherence protein C
MFDFAYLLIFAATTACVFGLAALFEKETMTVMAPTVRLGGSSGGWLAQLGRKFRPSEKERLTNRLWLLQAGYESPQAVQNYKAIRMLMMTVLALAVFGGLPIAKPGISTNNTLAYALLGAAAGLFGPLLFVQLRRSRRQQAIREGLPDALDLLLVCSEAGLGLDTAILKVGEELTTIHPVIAKCLQQISSELRAGRARAEAFRSFGDRAGIQETTSLVNLLIQTDALGTSMAATLRAFADDMRTHRLLRAEELGQKISVKLTMVLAGCFLPALMTAILTPVVSRILHTSFKMWIHQ